MKRKYLISIALMLCLLIVGTGSAEAKSAYVIANLNANPVPIQAYNLNPDGTFTYQNTNYLPRVGGGAVGIGIDTDSEMLFVTSEFSNVLQKINAVNFNIEGTQVCLGASNLAGIVVDQDKGLVYTIDRNTPNLFIYDVATFMPMGSVALPNAGGVYGIALDETTDLLYVASASSTIRYYDTATWNEQGTIAVTPTVIGVAVDATNGYVYSGGWYSNLMSKYDLGTGIETTKAVPSGSPIGFAVDGSAGNLYVTTYAYDRLLAYDSDLNLLDTTGDLGNPTGLCIPGKDISYNPLDLAKTDGVATVMRGGTLTYTISYTNTNPTPVTGVTITDTLPSGVTWVSGGTHAAGVVTWNIGGLATGESGSVTVTVTVDSNTPIDTVLDNAATIDSDNTPPTTQHDTTKVVSDTEIPEFPTIAIPMIAILGLAFMFQRRKD